MGLVGLLMRDMALTHDEVVGLTDGLLTSWETPTGTTRLRLYVLSSHGDLPDCRLAFCDTTPLCPKSDDLYA